MAEFVRVIAVGDLEDNQIKGLKVNGKYMAVVRVGEEVFAFDDTCTHAACSISPGEVDDYAAPCYCHGAVFDVRTGAVLQGPAGRPLQTFTVKLQDGDVYAEM